MSAGSLFNTIKTCTERTSRELARPPTFNKRQSKLGHSWSFGRAFVVKAEQLRAKQEKGKCRQRTLESAQAEYETMDARSFVVALPLEAAGLKRLTTEDKQGSEASPVR